MRTSDSIKELATALSKAQGAMAGAKKESDNPAFGSKYADLASIVDAIKKQYAEVLYVCIASDDISDSCMKLRDVLFYA